MESRIRIFLIRTDFDLRRRFRFSHCQCPFSLRKWAISILIPQSWTQMAASILFLKFCRKMLLEARQIKGGNEKIQEESWEKRGLYICYHGEIGKGTFLECGWLGDATGGNSDETRFKFGHVSTRAFFTTALLVCSYLSWKMYADASNFQRVYHDTKGKYPYTV